MGMEIIGTVIDGDAHIDHAIALQRAGQPAIKIGPAFNVYLAFERARYVEVCAQAQFLGDKIAGLPTNGDCRLLWSDCTAIICHLARFGIDDRLVFGPDIAAIDPQHAIARQRNEHTCARHFLRVIDRRTTDIAIDVGFQFTQARIDVLGQIVAAVIFFGQLVEFSHERIAGRLLGCVQRFGRARDPAMTIFMAIGQISGGLDPFPAFLGDLMRRLAQILRHHSVQQRHILHPAALIDREQVAHDRAARFLICCDPHKLCPAIAHRHGLVGQQSADAVRLIGIALADIGPDLLLAGMIGRDAECHQLVECHAVIGIDLEQGFGDGRQPQALLDDAGCHEEPRRDFLFRRPLLSQGHEGAELVERMQRLAHNILRQRILLGAAAFAHHAGHWLGFRHPFGLDQKFERTEAPAAGRYFELAGVLAIGIEDGPDVEALQQGATNDVVGKLADRDTAFDAPDIGLAENELVERDVARTAQAQLGN